MKKYGLSHNILKNRRTVSDSGFRNVGAVLLFVFLFPYILSFFFGNTGAWEDTAGIAEETFSRKESHFIICNTSNAGMEKIPMETYLIARLPATISMDYEPETLKAQAVILRTELMKQYYDGISGDSMEKVEKTDGGQIYLYVESTLCMTDGESYDKCRNAVESTGGMYLAYEGTPVMAPYFLVSAGATRNGNEVFEKGEYPYLKSVMCSRDFTAQDYAQSVSINRTALALQLHELDAEIVLTEEGQLAQELTLERDRAGYVTRIGTDGHDLSGETFRDAFGLASSCFTVEGEGDTVIFRTKGVGHGLGFCQYGANEAAKKGSDFIDILNYFFTDIKIEKTE